VPTLIGLGVLIVLLLAAIAFIVSRPADFRIQRSGLVDAPRDVVWSVINDLSQWRRWSPYDKRDPNMKTTLDGPSSGPGSSYSWNGNSQVGEGRLTITDTKPGELVAMKLEFLRPFKAENEVNFRLEPSGSGTRVSWIMDGKYNFVSKLMCLFMNMDKMVGTDFEQGLANLNNLVKAGVHAT
jgi:hypothetical protein